MANSKNNSNSKDRKNSKSSKSSENNRAVRAVRTVRTVRAGGKNKIKPNNQREGIQIELLVPLQNGPRERLGEVDLV
jgi:hypothetical protein